MKCKNTIKTCLFSLLLLFFAALCIPQTASAAGKPGKVTGLKCGITTGNSINISWSPQGGVSGYQIYRSSCYDGPYKKVKDIAAGNHAFCNLSLQGGREYYYRVRARRGSAAGSFSKILTARTKGASRAATIRVSSNIRKHAGTNHPVLATLPSGSKVTLTCTTNASDGASWSRITFKIYGKKRSGYIRSDLLSSGGQAKKHKGTVVANSGLNLRKSASVSSQLIATLPRGTVVTVLKGIIGSDGQKWYQVSVKRNGKTLKGYVFAKYIRVS